jgi:putative tricarboxylic transport membrane protein
MRELGAAVVLLAAALAGLVEAWRLPLGRVVAPGPGFFPFTLAAGLTVTAVLLLVRARRRPAPAPPPATPGGRARLVTVVVALFAYTALLGWLGFVLATFLLMLALFRAAEPHRWPVTLLAAASAAVLGHVLFKTWLGVRLPPGPWGF